MLTTHQGSYIAHNNFSKHPYNKNIVQGQLQHTNWRQLDGHRTWDTYQSTMGSDYTPGKEIGQYSQLHRESYNNHGQLLRFIYF